MSQIRDPVPASQSACDDNVWHVDETNTLEIEVDGTRLAPRRCELRHMPQPGLTAVKFAAQWDEISALTDRDATTWRFTLRRNGVLLRDENGWRVARLDEAGESKYEVCLEPV
jgi:hypothetical protein